jgi:hypothetical protein
MPDTWQLTSGLGLPVQMGTEGVVDVGRLNVETEIRSNPGVSEHRERTENRLVRLYFLGISREWQLRSTGRGCEKMGLAPSRNGENPGKTAVSKVPVPIFHSLVATHLFKTP